MRLIVGMSGASGVIYGIRLLEVLKPIAEVETHLVVTNDAKLNISLETDRDPEAVEALADEVHGNQDLATTISSGSFRTEGMVVAPCSMKTPSRVALLAGPSLHCLGSATLPVVGSKTRLSGERNDPRGRIEFRRGSVVPL